MLAVTERNGDVFMYGGLDSNWKAHQDTWKLKFATNEWKWEQLPEGPEAKLTYSADSVG